MALIQFAFGANSLRLTRGAPRIDATMQPTKLDRRKTDHSTAGANRAGPGVTRETTSGAINSAQTPCAAHGAADTALEAAFVIAPAAAAAVVRIHVQKGPYHVPGSVL